MILDAALAYRRKGLSVIPIKPKDKKPLINWEPFQKEAAAEETLKHWFESWPTANVGIVTGAVSNLVVIDIDSDEARQKLKSAVSDCDLSTVPRSRTGKGWQLFFKHPVQSIPNRAAVIPAVDVRGDGGYVVAPPSIHPNGRQYNWEVALNGHLPELPPELLKLITAQPTPSNYSERFNTAEALKGVPEGQRDQTLFKLACKLRNADVPREMAEQLILEAAKNCEPPFPERTAIEKIARAFRRYEPKQPQSESGEQPSFWPEPLSAKQWRNRPMDKQRWLIDKMLAFNSSSILVAPARHGKSTFAVNAGLSIARGMSFLGRDVSQTRVLYLSLDNSAADMDDLTQNLGMTDDDDIFIHVGAIPEDSLGWLRDFTTRHGYKLIIIDTLQRFFELEDANNYAECVRRMSPVDNFAKEMNLHVMYLHHAGKNGTFLGSTAFKAMCPTYMQITRVGDLQQRIFSTDQRNGKNFEAVAIGFDKRGWIQLVGTYEDAMINETIPKIREFLQMEDQPIQEIKIREGVGGRGIIASKALRKMLDGGTVARIGSGKRGDAFKYYLAPDLLNRESQPMDDQSERPMDNPQDCHPKRGIVKGENDSLYSCPISGKPTFGTRIAETAELIENKGSTQVRQHPDMNGPESKKEEASGLESEDGFEVFK